MWAFFQKAFVENSSNTNNATRLLFPMIVPILAGVFVYIGYIIFLKHIPNQSIAKSLKIRVNLLFIILPALGLAAAYFLYTLLISADPKNIAIIPVLNMVGLAVIAFFVTYKEDKFKFELNASTPEIIGAVITFAGVIIMKYSDSFFNK